MDEQLPGGYNPDMNYNHPWNAPEQFYGRPGIGIAGHAAPIDPAGAGAPPENNPHVQPHVNPEQQQPAMPTAQSPVPLLDANVFVGYGRDHNNDGVHHADTPDMSTDQAWELFFKKLRNEQPISPAIAAPGSKTYKTVVDEVVKLALLIRNEEIRKAAAELKVHDPPLGVELGELDPDFNIDAARNLYSGLGMCHLVFAHIAGCRYRWYEEVSLRATWLSYMSRLPRNAVLQEWLRLASLEERYISDWVPGLRSSRPFPHPEALNEGERDDEVLWMHFTSKIIYEWGKAVLQCVSRQDLLNPEYETDPCRLVSIPFLCLRAQLQTEGFNSFITGHGLICDPSEAEISNLASKVDAYQDFLACLRDGFLEELDVRWMQHFGRELYYQVVKKHPWIFPAISWKAMNVGDWHHVLEERHRQALAHAQAL